MSKIKTLRGPRRSGIKMNALIKPILMKQDKDDKGTGKDPLKKKRSTLNVGKEENKQDQGMSVFLHGR